MLVDLNFFLQHFSLQQHKPVDQLQWRRMIVIGGPGGSRTDFVTGWLDDQYSLTGCTKPNWKIQPSSGRTALDAHCYWAESNFRLRKDVSQEVDWLRAHYSPTGPVLCQKYHDPTPMYTMLPSDILQKTDTVYIKCDPTRDSVCSMIWEFMIKSMLKRTWDPALFGYIPGYPYSDTIVRDHVRGLIQHTLTTEIMLNPATHIVSYSDIVSERGSYVLGELLKFDVDHEQHVIWRRGIQAAQTETRAQGYGREWTRSEVEDIYDEVVSTINP